MPANVKKVIFKATATVATAQAAIPLPAAPQQNQMMAQPRATGLEVEFDGTSVALKIGENKQTWNINEHGYVDILAGYTLEHGHLDSIQGIDPAQNKEALQQANINRHRTLAIHDGRLLILPTETQAYGNYDIWQVGVDQIRPADNQDQLRNAIKSNEQYKTQKTALLQHAMIAQLNTMLEGIVPNTERDAILRDLCSIPPHNTNLDSLTRIIQHYTTDDSANPNDGLGDKRTLATLIPATTTADTINGEQLNQLFTFLEHFEGPATLPSRIAFKALLPDRNNTEEHRAPISQIFKAKINISIKAGVANKYIIKPLRDSAIALCGESARGLKLTALTNAISQAKTADIQNIANDLIQQSRTLNALLNRIANENNIDNLNNLETKLDELLANRHLAAPAARPQDANNGYLNEEQRQEFHKLIRAAKNQIQLKIADVITKNDQASESIKNALKPLLETHQEYANSALLSNQLDRIEALQAETHDAIDNLVQLHTLDQQHKSLEKRLDNLAKDPDFKTEADSLKKELGTKKEAFDTAIKNKDAAAAENAIQDIVQKIEQKETSHQLYEDISTLRKDFYTTMQNWLNARPKAPSEIKAQWDTLAQAFEKDIAAMQTLLANVPVDNDAIAAYKKAAVEKTPGKKSLINTNRPTDTAATNWLNTLTQTADMFKTTGLTDELFTDELFVSIFPAGERRTRWQDRIANTNPRGLPQDNPEFIENQNNNRANLLNGNDPRQLRGFLDGLSQETNTLANVNTQTTVQDCDDLNNRLKNLGNSLNARTDNGIARNILNTVTHRHNVDHVGANQHRSRILTYNLQQLPDITVAAPGNALDEVHHALGQLPETIRNKYAQLRTEATNQQANIDRQPFNNEFNTATHALTRARFITRAALLISRVNQYYNDGADKNKTIESLQAIAEAAAKDGCDTQQLKYVLDLQANDVMLTCYEQTKIKPSDNAVQRLKKLDKQLKLAGATAAQRLALQNHVFDGHPPAGQGFFRQTDDMDFPPNFHQGDLLSDRWLNQQARTPLYVDSPKFLSRVNQAIEHARQAGQALAEMQELENWAKYQKLLHLVNALQYTDDQKTALQNNAIEGLDLHAPADAFITTPLTYNQKQHLNEDALNNAFDEITTKFESLAKNNQDKTKENIKRLKYFARFLAALENDLERIANERLSTLEAEQLDGILEKAAKHIALIPEALALAQKEIDQARMSPDQNIKRQQDRIQAALDLQSDLLKKPQALQILLDKIHHNKDDLKTKGTPHLSLGFQPLQGGTQVTGETRPIQEIDPKKLPKMALHGATGQHFPVSRLDDNTNRSVSFTITTKNQKTCLFVPDKNLHKTPGALPTNKSTEEKIAAFVDVANRGLAALEENTREKPLMVQSDSIKHLWMQVYALQTFAGKNPSQIQAYYTGDATSLAKLTTDWSLAELEARLVEQLAPKMKGDDAGFFNSGSDEAKIAKAKQTVEDFKTKMQAQNNELKKAMTTTNNLSDETEAENLATVRDAQDQVKPTGRLVAPVGGGR